MSDAPAPAAPAAPAPAADTTPKPVNGVPRPAPKVEAVGGKPVEAAGAEVDQLAQYLKAKPVTIRRRDGREVKVDSIEHLRNLASQGFSATQEIEQARAERAEAQAIKEWRAQLKKDPRSVLRQELGEDAFREISTQEALDAYEADLKLRGVPEQLKRELVEARKTKQERDQLAAQQQAEAQRRAQQQHEYELQQAQQMLLQDGVEALKAVGFSEKPPTSTVMRMAPYLAEAIDMGLGPEHAAKLLREDMQNEHRAIAASFVAAKDGAGLEAWLGKDVADAIARHRVAKLRGAAAAPPQANGQPQQEAPRAKTPEEIRAWLRGR